MEEGEKPNGRFVKGQSGNPLGRPRKVPRTHRLPSSNRVTAFEVAEMPLLMTSPGGGEPETTTFYRGVLIAMAKKALSGHAPSQRAFLDQIEKAAAAYGDSHALVQFLFREMAKLETLNDQYEATAIARKTGVLVVDQEEWDRRTLELNRKWEERRQRGFT